ncbi:MAG: AtzE family amidohydrolase [Coleofasciculaceae cyanobacterium SM2_1_6]|nr:AtzE family amidohydrolase [Coleofasciculaceae cyanobacterium SM2_1_6]
MNYATSNATEISAAIKSGQTTAKAVTIAALEQIDRLNPVLNAFTTILREQAIQDAEIIDQRLAQGEDPGVLTGVPFAVKDLVDIQGVVTLAGSKINQENSPATEDATTVKALKAAGAVLVGACVMDEYAYGFSTENSHYGASHNPHNLDHVAGGSSGGSAAAVAGGLVPLTLGSDTNGSIRVPASLCGIFGLKPTYGRVSRFGTYPFAGSFDHIGPFARSVSDLATIFDCLQGYDPQDPVSSNHPVVPTLPELSKGLEGIKLAIADGHFAKGAHPEAFQSLAKVAAALEVTTKVTIPEAHRARAAAFIITACEGANLHLERLKTRPFDFDLATRDRFLAGALIPASWYLQAQRFRSWYREQVKQVFQTVDVIIAPTTPCVAPKIGQQTIIIDGVELLARPNLGVFTQPLSFIGLPIISVPVHLPDSLPLGVQLIAAPYNEALILRVAKVLEDKGIVAAPVPQL